MGIDTDLVKSIPPTLRNIAKEVESDVGFDYTNHAFDFSLESWAEQGVLLLNTALTVEEGVTKSHFKQWQPFTTYLMNILNDMSGLVFVMLGKDAQRYLKFIDSSRHHCVTAPHPAAEVYAGGNAGFFGSKIFSKINEILNESYSYNIEWQNLRIKDEQKELQLKEK